MARTGLFHRTMGLLRIAVADQRSDAAPDEALERARAGALTRRRLLADAGRAALLLGTAGVLPAFSGGRPGAAAPSVGVVGAGLAGLMCARELIRAGLDVVVHDAAVRVGGRCWTAAGRFPGQVAERGGEFIDTGHKTMIALAREFGLALEDVGKQPGAVSYRFAGQMVSEETVVEEFRAFVPALHADLRRLSGEVTADQHTAEDARLDRISLEGYLSGENALGLVCPPRARAALRQSYIAEYGLEPDRQSALNLLFFIHADRRSKFRPFGVFSDERYHVVAGNDRIVAGLSGQVGDRLRFGRRLEAVARLADGRVRLSFAGGIEATHDHVVLAIPFTVLRGVALDPALGIPAQQVKAIRELGYGTNAKHMIGLAGRPWRALGGNGSSYSDLADHQATWETNPATAAATRAIITDYAGGDRGARLDPGRAQREAERFVAACDLVIPGVATAAVRDRRGALLTEFAHWPSDPLARGSYTCYTPGQFTTIAGREGLAVGNLHFAGEHTDSFYSWQGFMEGACLSGLRAADEVVAAAPRAAG